MKLVLLLMGSLVLANSVKGQSSIDWLSIDGGGGVSSSATYSLGATFGQADAGQSSSASYAIVGGFWALESLSPGAGLPELHIGALAGNQVRLWWASPATGFVLQSADHFGDPAGWSSVPGLVADDGTTRSVTIAPGTSPRFYRLRKN